jgi:glucose/arabinose dehydrogenase
MRYRHFLFLGLVGAAGLLGACFDGDDDDDNTPDAAAPPDAAPSSDGGSPTTDATVPDGGTPSSDGGTVTDASDASIFPHNDGGPLTIPARCNGAISSPNNPANPAPPERGSLGLADGFELINLAQVADGPRQLLVLPNGDMLVATNGSNVYLITNADGAQGTSASAPTVFASFPGDPPAQGIAYDPTTCIIYVGTQHAIYAMPYVDAQTTGVVGAPIATFRQVPPDAGHNDDIHTTTSLAVVPGGSLYAAIGSDCNACKEVDPTRATIQQMNLDGTNMVTKATRVRNAIAMAVNPNNGAVWAGGAGQDGLPQGHPLEWFDNVTSHSGEPDYGWPDCEENQVAYTNGANCSSVVVPEIEMPAYQTLIGAVFYPNDSLSNERPYDFGATYRGGLFITGHGSWHLQDAGGYATAPIVAYFPMDGGAPATPVNFSDPTVQWTPFIFGFQNTVNNTTRYGRPTGITVGPKGTLFIADDMTTDIYYMRPD